MGIQIIVVVMGQLEALSHGGSDGLLHYGIAMFICMPFVNAIMSSIDVVALFVAMCCFSSLLDSKLENHHQH